MDDLSEELSFGLELAEEADRHILPRFRNCAVNYKSDGTEVTDADRSAEFAMRTMISGRFRHDGVLGEEFGFSGPEHSRRRWILDPIDGTAWFTLGIPTFGTLIALCEDDEPVMGVIHFPALQETMYAAKGLGCWLKLGDGDRERVRVAEHVPLTEATISASGPHGSNIQTQPTGIPLNLIRVIGEARKFKFVGDCLQHALVSRGKIHAAIDTVMKPWELAAIVPCIEEAGGVVTDLSGNRSAILLGGSLLTSCSEELHTDVLRELATGVAPAREFAP